MLLVALLSLAVTQAPPLPPGLEGSKVAPTALETARLYFLAGDVANAKGWAQRGLKKEAKTCKPLLRDLAEYAYLIGKYDELTLDEARQVLELDRRISPKARGKLTVRIEERFVTGPLKRARDWAVQGAAAEAVAFVDDVLKVEPGHAEAKALRLELLSAADGGVWPGDAGR